MVFQKALFILVIDIIFMLDQTLLSLSASRTAFFVFKIAQALVYSCLLCS